MATTTTQKLYMRFTNEATQDRTWSFNYMDDTLTQAQVTAIATAFTMNSQAFKSGYQPQAIVAVWWESITKDYVISE